MIKRFLALTVLLCVLTSLFVPVNVLAQKDTAGKQFKNVSDWALYEIESAYEKKLIPDSLLGKSFNEPVSRGEFAAIAVTLYESLTDEKLTSAVTPFIDIKGNENARSIEKAYKLGITAGVSQFRFAPDDFISREQFATMLCRVFKKYTYEDWSLTNDRDYPLFCDASQRFKDDAQISDFAKESVRFLSLNSIINGMGDNKFTEKNTDADYTTREQAVIIALRCYENLFKPEIVNTAHLYPDVSPTNKIPHISKFTLDSPDEIDQAVLYDTIDYLKVDFAANISDFSFLKDINVGLLQVLYTRSKPFDLKCINSASIERLFFHNAELINTEAVAGFKKLYYFTMQHDRNQPQIKNLDFLSECTNMKEINIQNYGITNLDFARNMTKLMSLSVINSSVEDIGGIANCSGLESLTLQSGKISDISAVSNLKKLYYIDMTENYIEDTDPINTLWKESLSYIDFSDNYITKINIPDVSLAEKTIYLSQNYISEIPAELCTASVVDLSSNNIREIAEDVKSVFEAGDIHIDLYDNLLNEGTIREIAKNDNVKFGMYTTDEAVKFSNKIREILPQLEMGTEYEKVIKITKYVKDNIRLDYTYSDPHRDDAYGALFSKVVCTGSTDLTNSLCRHLGIKAKSYHGDMEDANDGVRHVWSVVCIGGNYYHCDAMQSTVYETIHNFPGIALLSDEEIKKYTHIPDALNMFECNTVIDDFQKYEMINSIMKESL